MPSNFHRVVNSGERKWTQEKIVAELLKRQPEASDRRIAKDAGVSHPTVSKICAGLEATGKIFQLKKTA
jgi:hypothetical protein